MRYHGPRATWLCLLLAALLSGGAYAQSSQPAADPKLEQEQRRLAKKFFREAEVSYKKGDFAAALADYERAYILTQEPLLLYNQGQCYRQLRRYQEALDTYQRFLELRPDDATYAPLARRWLEEIQLETGLRPTAPEPAPTTEPASLPASEPASAPVASAPTSAPQPEAPTPEALAASQPGSAPAPEGPDLARGLLALGGVSAGVGLGTGLAALRLGAKSEELQGEAATEQEAAERAQEIARLRGNALLLGRTSDLAFVGAALGAAGFFLLKRAERAKDAGLVLSPSGATVRVEF